MALEPLRQDIVRHAHDIERLIRRQLIGVNAGALTDQLQIQSGLIHFSDSLGKSGES